MRTKKNVTKNQQYAKFIDCKISSQHIFFARNEGRRLTDGDATMIEDWSKIENLKIIKIVLFQIG